MKARLQLKQQKQAIFKTEYYLYSLIKSKSNHPLNSFTWL